MFTYATPEGIMYLEHDNIIQKYIKLEDWKKLLPGLMLHSGRTDYNGGHRVRTNANGYELGNYHYHHGLPPHLHPDGHCPYGDQEGQHATIANPYTGKIILLGTPYYFQNTAYYSLNLVSKALTVYDERGVDLALEEGLFGNSPGGVFYACSSGDSSWNQGNEQLLFTYPRGILGLRDNTLFETNCGKIQLLCHTTKTLLDTINCYAYISLAAVRAYMTKDGYFIDLSKNEFGLWSFEVKKPRLSIYIPRNNETFYVGDKLEVKADIIDAASAVLAIGSYRERKEQLESNDSVTFNEVPLTEEHTGNLDINVEADIGGTAIRLNTVRTVLIHVKRSGHPTIINDWLRLYDTPTASSNYQHLVNRHPNANTYDWAAPEELSGVKGVPQNSIPEAARRNITQAGGVWTVNLENNNLYSDAEGRYWVAVGPAVMNPNRTYGTPITESEMQYGTKIDIHVHDKSGKDYYIPAVVGDAKNHSYPDGLYQTGVCFDTKQLAAGHIDLSTVEFMGWQIIKGNADRSSVNITNNYALVGIIVYVGTVNY